MLVAGACPPTPCGVGDYVARLAQALGERQDVTLGLLTRRGDTAVSQSAVDVVEAAVDWRWSESAAIRSALRAWRADVVHIHYPSQGFYGRALPAFLPMHARLAGCRVVQTWHEAWPLRALPRVMLQRAYADGLVFVRPDYLQLTPAALRPLLKGIPSMTLVNAGVLPVSTLDAPQRQALRARLLNGRSRLVVFFGFVYPAKGVEQLFQIADSRSDAIVIAGPCPDAAYRSQLEAQAASQGWGEAVHYTGFLDPSQAADLLAVADAVVLPLRDGAGEWNTSVHAARAQGTLVIATSREPRGDEPERNLYTAPIGDVAAMRLALDSLAGRKVAPVSPTAAWAGIAARHHEFYDRIVNAPTAKP